MEIVQKPFFGKFSNFLILAIMFHEHNEREQMIMPILGNESCIKRHVYKRKFPIKSFVWQSTMKYVLWTIFYYIFSFTFIFFSTITIPPRITKCKLIFPMVLNVLCNLEKISSVDRGIVWTLYLWRFLPEKKLCKANGCFTYFD